MNEFDYIASYFSPLAQSSGALGLRDDAALLEVESGYQLVLTKDVLVENVHFFSGDDPKILAKKMLRVNLSDLAAMGAMPIGYMLGLVVPYGYDKSWFSAFSEGLAEENSRFNISVLGGDTVTHDGALTLSVTAFGKVKNHQALYRNRAQAGDAIYVTGTLGDSALGLKLLQDAIEGVELPRRQALIARYHLPDPRVELGMKLYPLVNAAMDISDGLLQDLGHICRYSDVGAEVFLENMPLSDAAKSIIQQDSAYYKDVVTGGDDYELLLTVPAKNEAQLQILGDSMNLPITRIGCILEGSGVVCFDTSGCRVTYDCSGYRHF